VSCVWYGPGSADELFTQVVRIAPALGKPNPQNVGFGLIGPGGDDMAWVPMQGSRGAAIVVFAFSDSDSGFATDEVVNPLLMKKLPSPWRSTLGTRSNEWDASAADVINSARAFPVWELSALAPLAPDKRGVR